MSAKTRVLLCINPISGGIDKEDITLEVKQNLPRERYDLEIFRTTGKNDEQAAASIIGEFKPDRILVAGGDGTLKLIAEIVKTDGIPIGLLPMGSANGLAENLEIPEEISAMINVALGDHFETIDGILINDELCLHISDIGLNAALIKNYDQGNIRGKLGYLIQSIPTLIKSDFPFSFKISTGGRTIEREAVLLAIANAKKYGTGSTINPRGKYNDGQFEILVFKKFDISEILKTFQEEAELSPDFLEIFPASQARIECAKKVPFQIDGEYRGEVTEVIAKIAPFKIKIAVPQSLKK